MSALICVYLLYPLQRGPSSTENDIQFKILGSALNNIGCFLFYLFVVLKCLTCLLCVDDECLYAGMWLPWHLCGGQRINFKSQFSLSSTGSWDWTQVMQCFYPVSHLTRPLFAFLSLTHHLGSWILAQKLFHAVHNFKSGLLGKFTYLYSGALGGLEHFPEYCWHGCHNVRMWWKRERESCGGIGQHHSSLNLGYLGKRMTSFLVWP